jgi:hypothetical protein
MQPYATASEPSPLNGNRPSVNANANANANNSFFTKYRNPILYSLGVIVLILIVTMIIRKRRSFYDVKKVETSKKVKKCPKGCVPAPKKKKKKKVVKDPKKGTSFDPKLTSK